MLTTFESSWKEVLLKAPGTPIPIAQNCVNRAYQRALDSYRWSGLRGEAEIVIPAAYSTGTVTVTQGSNVVTGSLTTWTSAMTGRQFFVNGTVPYYTFTFTSPTTGTLDRNYAGADAVGASYTIQLVYVSPASDFLHFTSVRDVENNWRLRFDRTQEWLDRIDTRRTSSGSIWTLVAAPFTGSPPKYEVWPRPPVAGKVLPYRYIRRASDLSAPSDVPIYPIRSSGLVEGALAELAIWPGLDNLPNPYFNPGLQQVHESRFQDVLQKYEREDQEISQTDVTNVDSGLNFPPMDAKYFQEHALPAF